MNFKDRDIREQVEIAEKQIDAFRKHFQQYVKDNEMDPGVVMAAILSIIAHAIANQVGHDEAEQDAHIAFIVKGIYVSLAENGYRAMDDSIADAIPPWEKN